MRGALATFTLRVVAAASLATLATACGIGAGGTLSTGGVDAGVPDSSFVGDAAASGDTGQVGADGGQDAGGDTVVDAAADTPVETGVDAGTDSACSTSMCDQDPCCPGLTCSAGQLCTSACLPANSGCDPNLDLCCPGSPCLPTLQCGPPLTNGQPCSQDEQCQSGNCCDTNVCGSC